MSPKLVGAGGILNASLFMKSTPYWHQSNGRSRQRTASIATNLGLPGPPLSEPKPQMVLPGPRRGSQAVSPVNDLTIVPINHMESSRNLLRSPTLEKRSSPPATLRSSTSAERVD
jgi:hypothetical protein